ncbi:MAG: hypothetical protein M3O82_08185 [Verrucomicrobiota bacterium]|nr:hypothetical protein [Verrucomicrobiota bacterium]
MRTWKPAIAVVVFAISAAGAVHAQTPAPTPNTVDLANRRMFVDPSSTSVSLGKARLTVSPLSHKEGTYAGDYQLKVVPYFFKSQKGPLVLVTSDDLISKLSQGLPVEFTGKATNSTDGTFKVVKGKATPSSDDKGVVAFSIPTDNGEMVFNTNYHFGK